MQCTTLSLGITPKQLSGTEKKRHSFHPKQRVKRRGVLHAARSLHLLQWDLNALFLRQNWGCVQCTVVLHMKLYGKHARQNHARLLQRKNRNRHIATKHTTPLTPPTSRKQLNHCQHQSQIDLQVRMSWIGMATIEGKQSTELNPTKLKHAPRKIMHQLWKEVDLPAKNQ